MRRTPGLRWLGAVQVLEATAWASTRSTRPLVGIGTARPATTGGTDGSSANATSTHSVRSTWPAAGWRVSLAQLVEQTKPVVAAEQAGVGEQHVLVCEQLVTFERGDRVPWPHGA
jgi:hypothetical protein